MLSPYFSLLSLFVVFLSHFPLPKNENTNDFLIDLKHLTFRSIRSITGTTHDPTMHDPWQKVSQTENVRGLSALRQSESLFSSLACLARFLYNTLYAACGKVINHGALQLTYSVLITCPVFRPFYSETLKSQDFLSKSAYCSPSLSLASSRKNR